MKRNKITQLIYTGLQWTWGLPQTLAGAGLYLRHRKDPHFNYKGARVTCWNKTSGISLGRYIFVPEKKGWSTIQTAKSSEVTQPETKRTVSEDNVSRFLLEHEYGHTIQSLILGPLYLILVGAPSFLWNRLPYFERKRRKTGRSYYSAVFERTANTLGERISAKTASEKKRSE